MIASAASILRRCIMASSSIAPRPGQHEIDAAAAALRTFQPTWCRQTLHHTIRQTLAVAATTTVAGNMRKNISKCDPLHTLLFQ
jgi:hypothetical protein